MVVETGLRKGAGGLGREVRSCTLTVSRSPQQPAPKAECTSSPTQGQEGLNPPGSKTDAASAC